MSRDLNGNLLEINTWLKVSYHVFYALNDNQSWVTLLCFQVWSSSAAYFNERHLCLDLDARRIDGELPGSYSGSRSRSRMKNVTNVLAQLLDDYDIRLRPDFGGNRSISTTDEGNQSRR